MQSNFADLDENWNNWRSTISAYFFYEIKDKKLDS